MDGAGKLITYGESVRFEQAARAAYADLAYTPTFRASAIFFVLVEPGLDTRVGFVNYWREKNANRAVSALVTLRDAEGRRRRREFFHVTEAVYDLSARDLLGGDSPFMGSLEVELFSTEDLKYAFPALEAIYESRDGVSFVHSNQRVFAGIEDLDRNSTLNPWQTGFDLYADDDYTGYLTVINGPRPVRGATVAVKLYNAEGQARELRLGLGDLPAYGARLVILGDRPDVRAFLGERPGFCKADLDTFGVFNRIACGNLARDRSRLVVTHSYYDCSGHRDYYERAHIPEGEYACFLPFNLVDGLDLDLVFYPIYAPSTLDFSLDCFGEDGRLRARLEKFARFEGAGTTMLRLDVRTLLARHGVSADGGVYCLDLEAVDGHIPARAAFGMNYRRGRLGCNINSSVLMNKGYGIRRRFYAWGPLVWREGGRNWILVSHLSKVRGAREEAELTVQLYARGGHIGRSVRVTRNATALNLDGEALVRAAGYRPRHNEVLWYTLESVCPNYTANQVHVSATGFVGGDHSF